MKLLILFGSRARGDNYEDSDWDFAMLFDESLRQQYESGAGGDRYRSWILLQRLFELGDDEMDWIDLKDASELLAHAIARDGVVLYEHELGRYFSFFHGVKPNEYGNLVVTNINRSQYLLRQTLYQGASHLGRTDFRLFGRR